MYAKMQQHLAQPGGGGGHAPAGYSGAPVTGSAAPEAGASTGTTGAGIPPGYVVVEQRYVAELEHRVDAMQEEMRGLRDDRERLASALRTLERLAPAIERIAEADPSTAAALQATVGILPRAPSILSPDRPMGALDDGDVSIGVGPDAARGPPPPRTVSDVRIWTGSWNVGAKDPFAGMDVDKNLDVVERVLSPFVPRDYDIYVLGVQEGVNDSLYRAVARFTGCYQLPLHAKLEPAKEAAETAGVRSRRMGRAVCVQEFINDARKGKHPQRAASMTDMLDRVWGRGDGALMRQKFTGIAVFVTPSAAPYVRLLGVYKHSFGASEGSKGGVGVALGVYDSTIAFVTAHMASKRIDMRRQQYCDLVERLGAKLGGRGFQLTEEFHHVVWMGDLNYHCSKCSAEEAAAMLRTGRVADLLLEHDELIQERAQGVAFYDFEEPNMVPDFYPTYKRHTARGHIDMESDPDWVKKMYMLEFKEAIYKGGRTVERVPSWADRIMFRSLPSRADDLLPESLDPGNKDAPHNYRAVNHGCDISDHAPVFCTWTLRIRLDPIDETLPEGMDEADEGVPAGVIGRGTLGVSPQLLHPALRPLNVILAVSNIKVNYRPAMRSPRALSILFPLPYEDGDDIPERAKIVRTGTMMSISSRSDSREGLSGSISVLLSRANKLADMHFLLKVSLEDSTKAQAVVSMRECGITDVGRMTVTRFSPLMRNGLRAVVGGASAGPLDMEFTLEYHGHYVSDEQVAAAGMGYSSASGAGAAVPRSVAAERLRQIGSAMLAPTPHQAAAAASSAGRSGFGAASFAGRHIAADLDAAADASPSPARYAAAAAAPSGPGPFGHAGDHESLGDAASVTPSEAGRMMMAPAPAADAASVAASARFRAPARYHGATGCGEAGYGEADYGEAGYGATGYSADVAPTSAAVPSPRPVAVLEAGGGSSPFRASPGSSGGHPYSAPAPAAAAGTMYGRPVAATHAPGVSVPRPAAAMYGQMRPVPAPGTTPAPVPALGGDNDDDDDVLVDSDDE